MHGSCWQADWKGNADMSLEFKYEKYNEAIAQTADLLPEANAKLLELEAMVRAYPTPPAHLASSAASSQPDPRVRASP